MTNSDNSRWDFGYDSLGQVTSGKKYWSDHVPVAGEQFEYGFDDIGNRVSAKDGGDQFGGNLRSVSYSANNLNQYTSRTVSGYVNIVGSATNTATVTVNNQPTYRHGDFYRAELQFDNTSSAVYPSLTNLAVLNQGTNADILTNVTGNVFLPQTPETFSYDDDGNLTGDGRWTNHWDAENRLISMESLTNGPAGSKLRLNFGYDYRGRRITKTVEQFDGSQWNVVLSQRFLYDGWNLLAELNATNNAVIRSYLWGLDLSGGLQGAGGVGGLLAVSSPSASQFVNFDGNGNVSALFQSSTAIVVAQYEYGPFGELLRATGFSTQMNPFVFSTLYSDKETELLYCKRRFLNTPLGRWTNRDPINELGFKVTCGNQDPFDSEGESGLYISVHNNPINYYDPFGTCSCAFTGHTGKLTVNCNCKGILPLWVIDEHQAPAAGATCGTSIYSDGFVLGGTTYKIDGSTCAEIDCSGGNVRITACVNYLACIVGKRAPYEVPSGSFGGSPKEPNQGASPPYVN